MSDVTDRLSEIDARLARISSPNESPMERRMSDVRLRVEDVPDLVAALRAVLALHAKVETPRHGCCARPRLCDGHAPECSAREHGVSKPPWPCPTVRAITSALEVTT